MQSEERDDRFARSSEVRKMLGGISVATLTRWVSEGKFPAPQKIGIRNYWRLSAIESFRKALPARAIKPREADRAAAAQ